MNVLISDTSNNIALFRLILEHISRTDKVGLVPTVAKDFAEIKDHLTDADIVILGFGDATRLLELCTHTKTPILVTGAIVSHDLTIKLSPRVRHVPDPASYVSDTCFHIRSFIDSRTREARMSAKTRRVLARANIHGSVPRN